MKFDYVTLYNKNATFYHAHPKAKRALKLGNLLLSGFFVACYPLLLLFMLSHATSHDGAQVIMSILFPPAIALLVVSVLRDLIYRPRPYASEGAGIEPLVQKRSADYHSFPSRHLTCAAVIAMVYLPFYPFACAFLLIASVLLGYIRFALGLHYLSDLLAGEAMGILFGSICFLFL
jgi:undecaprenyl-diphosphatase